MSSISCDPAERWQREGAAASVRGAIPGWFGSLFLHGLFVFLLVAVIRSTVERPSASQQLVPVNIVQLGENTTSPPREHKASVPQQRAAVQRSAYRSLPAAFAPARNLSPPDSLEAQLRALSKLRKQGTNLPALDNAGASDVDTASDNTAFGARAAYSLRDYIRNQVERRWSLNLGRVGESAFTVLIHVAISRNGTVTRADIVDSARFVNDAAYRDAALSARNAVMLSSPIAMPAGQRNMPLDIVLRLNPKDTLR